jgi:hypothetical protein
MIKMNNNKNQKRNKKNQIIINKWMMKVMMIKDKKYNNKLDKIKQNYKRNKKLIT